LDRDDNIDGAAIQFKRAFLTDELEWINEHYYQYPHPKIYQLIDEEESIIQSLQPLGSVTTPRGHMVFFPKSHVRKVDTMVKSNTNNVTGGISKRRIVVFFLVNPPETYPVDARSHTATARDHVMRGTVKTQVGNDEREEVLETATQQANHLAA
jgi:hypothetical protein